MKIHQDGTCVCYRHMMKYNPMVHILPQSRYLIVKRVREGIRHFYFAQVLGKEHTRLFPCDLCLFGITAFPGLFDRIECFGECVVSFDGWCVVWRLPCLCECRRKKISVASLQYFGILRDGYTRKIGQCRVRSSGCIGAVTWKGYEEEFPFVAVRFSSRDGSSQPVEIAHIGCHTHLVTLTKLGLGRGGFTSISRRSGSIECLHGLLCCDDR
mmetsp:Transcript_25128/g.36936  ORF Transcript_25128/g.36936 Transcript_25128/m.36936 type:complete len:212 (+) Transcript_25128:251-886(+)